MVIPEEDRFTPYGLTIHTGESVQWVNEDTDDHTVVSDDTFTTAGHQGTNHLLPGTDNTKGKFSTFTLQFSKAGVFVYDSASTPISMPIINPWPQGRTAAFKRPTVTSAHP